MFFVGSIITDSATVAGFMAAAIAVGGFLGHARPVLQRRGETYVRIATVIGGLLGLAVAIGVSLSPGVR